MRMQPVISVIIADDHALFRAGVNEALQGDAHIRVVGEAVNGKELLEMAGRLRPNVILMDIKMPVMDGIEATKILADEYPSIAVIALTMAENKYTIHEALNAGARGYLLKDAGKDDVVSAIESVHNGHGYYCREAQEKLTRQLNVRDPVPALHTADPLTDREKQVLLLICREYSTIEIARILHCGVRTIEKDRERLLEKTRRLNVAGLVVFAILSGIYDPGVEEFP